MKLLSIVVPCYNSAEYMGHCIETLLAGGEEVELILVDDGSTKDDTAMIADRYAHQYPGIIRTVHQENKGHGGAVNTGLSKATGLYFKVVDSDDWVNQKAYVTVMDKLREFGGENPMIDMLITNFVYEKAGKTKQQSMRYQKQLPQNRVFGWNDTKSFGMGKYILMHSVIYRRELLLECNLILPEHTFYVDNIFVYQPLPFVKRMYYLDVDFYRYYIGRADQSVSTAMMIERIDQQIRVNFEMVRILERNYPKKGNLCTYMLNYLNMITLISSIYLIKSGTKANLRKKKNLWKVIYHLSPHIHQELSNSLFGVVLHLPERVAKFLILIGYWIANKIYGFN